MKRYLILLLGLLATPVYSQSQPSWYEVELIVFENRNPDALKAEQWDDDPGRPTPDDAIALLHPDTLAAAADEGENGDVSPAGHSEGEASPQPTATDTQGPDQGTAVQPYVLLEGEALRLETVKQRLARSAIYEPLLHIAWRQPALPSGQAQPVYLHSGVTEYPPPQRDPQPLLSSPAQMDNGSVGEGSVATIPVSAGTALVSKDQATSPRPPLEGTVELRQNRYLHLGVDFVFRKKGVVMPAATDQEQETEHTPAATTDVSGESGAADDMAGEKPATPMHRTYNLRLTQSRRVRKEQLHYFDHPAFGVIAVIRPYELPEPSGEDGDEAPPF